MSAGPRRGVVGRRPAAPRAHRPEAGQATVELVLVLPALVLAALAIVQVGVVVHHQVLVDGRSQLGL